MRLDSIPSQEILHIDFNEPCTFLFNVHLIPFDVKLKVDSKPWVKRYDHRIAGLWLRRLRQAVTEKLGR